ncbi:MAG: sugar ABC transporter permease [Lachnospiraceae bacterium]|nr:sugar ABC transporter permease [Lachnospiraceae bacterium]
MKSKFNNKSIKRNIKRNLPGYLLLAPATIAVLALSIYPMIRGICLSFVNYNLVRAREATFNTFAGLENYLKIFSNDIFLKSLGNTVKWTLVNLIVQLVVAILLALALNQKLKGRSAFRIMTLVPWAIPPYIAVMTFTFLYSAQVGILNILAVRSGLMAEAVSWLGNIGSAFWCIVILSVWKGMPFQMIFILTALQGIPEEVYESAKIDGGSSWQIFWRITLPMIKEPLMLTTVLNVIGILSSFYPWMMTEGGPLYSTETIYTFAYRQAFVNNDFGTASASAVILFIFTTLLTGIYLRIIREKD